MEIISKRLGVKMLIDHEDIAIGIRLQGLTGDVNRVEYRVKDILNKIKYEQTEQQESMMLEELVCILMLL